MSFLRLLKAIANHLFIPDRMKTAEPKFCTHHKNDCYGRVNSTQTLFDMPFFPTKKRVLSYHNMIKTRFVSGISQAMRFLKPSDPQTVQSWNHSAPGVLISDVSMAPSSTPQYLRIFRYVPSSMSFSTAFYTASSIWLSPFLMTMPSGATPSTLPSISSCPSVCAMA